MKNFLFSLTIFISHSTYSQIASGVIDPDPHAQMELFASNKGLLIPRVILDNLNNPSPFDSNPIPIPESLLIYNRKDSPINSGYYYWNNNQWNKIATQTDIRDEVDGAGFGKNHWNIAGTTNPATNNNEDIYQRGHVGIGGEESMSPQALLDVRGDALINGLTIGKGGGNLASNTTIGSNALSENTTGEHNTAIGLETLSRNETGSNNTAIGKFALQYSYKDASKNTAIGFNAGPHGGYYGITTIENSTAIGYNAHVEESNAIKLGNNDITKVQTSGTYYSNGSQISSDRRYKENIQTIPLGLEFINRIHPVEYHRKNNKSNNKEWGVIAQELQQAIEKTGYKNAGIVEEDTTTSKYLSVGYTQLIAPIIKAIQELDQENASLKKDIQILKQEMKSLEQRFKQIIED